MNKNWKIALAVLAVVTLISSGLVIWKLGGWGGRGITQVEAISYVDGEIRAMYRNEYTTDYLEILGQDVSELQGFYQENLESETDFFLSYLIAEYPDEETTRRAQEIVAELYYQVSYQITEATQEENGDFVVAVTVYPVVLLDFLVTDFLDEMWELVVYQADIDWDMMTDVKYERLNQELDNIYTNMLLDAVEERLPDLSYGEGQALTVRMVQTDQGYVLERTDWYQLDQAVIDYYGMYRLAETETETEAETESGS